eukprot:TRINITY_DN1894_c0_g1_i4.p1 TRINITY_DN1894_c0_g1~~TRINITY_DN1894_c0_g1_i4.p1  ORF type:complete len:662 (-),score=152.89 TRINITY_DN1894_c0_g1_i4:443-2428(-)
MLRNSSHEQIATSPLEVRISPTSVLSKNVAAEYRSDCSFTPKLSSRECEFRQVKALYHTAKNNGKGLEGEVDVKEKVKKSRDPDVKRIELKYEEPVSRKNGGCHENKKKKLNALSNARGTKNKTANEIALSKKVKDTKIHEQVVHNKPKHAVSRYNFRNSGINGSKTVESFIKPSNCEDSKVVKIQQKSTIEVKSDLLRRKKQTINPEAILQSSLKESLKASFNIPKTTPKKHVPSKKVMLSTLKTQSKLSHSKPRVSTNSKINKSFILTLDSFAKVSEREVRKLAAKRIAARANQGSRSQPKIAQKDSSRSCCRKEPAKSPPKEKSEALLKLIQNTKVAKCDLYSFVVLEGNNSQLVRKCFGHRSGYWKEINNPHVRVNYKWQPVSNGIHFELLSKFSPKQMVNHFEGHREITTKDGLVKNLIAYCELNKLNAFDYTPLTFTLDIDSACCASSLEKFCTCFSILQATKDISNDQYLPQLNKKLSKLIFSKNRRTISHCQPKLSKTQFIGKNLWVLKPTGYNRGKGITVFDSIEKLKESLGLPSGYVSGVFVDAKKWSEPVVEMGKARTFVIQKYVERPLLVHKRKFDIRVWVLVTHELKVYFFREGYLRTSSELFTLEKDSIAQRNVHLTNNAVQKHCNGYGQFEDGNQLSFAQFQVPAH